MSGHHWSGAPCRVDAPATVRPRARVTRRRCFICYDAPAEFQAARHARRSREADTVTRVATLRRRAPLPPHAPCRRAYVRDASPRRSAVTSHRAK